jgi:hydrogenase maturation protein HypF
MASVLALGAYLKNRACRLDAGGGIAWSALHGDLGTREACTALEASAERLLDEAEGRIDAVAHDLHPDFHSTRVALALAGRLGVPAHGVQHHHAHIAVVLAEQHIEAPVIGLALDGMGLGSDGTAWGGELLWVHGARWRRVGHLQPVALPGGDVAAREPWRVAAAALHALGRGAEIEARFGTRVGPARARGVQRMLARGLNCPPTTSAGRWFDAASAALGLSFVQTGEAEAAIALERCAADWLARHDIGAVDEFVRVEQGRIDLRPLLARLLELGKPGDRGDHGEVGRGAALFHAALAQALAGAAAAAAADAGLRRVVLGGGCFLNRVLTERVRAVLARSGLEVLMPRDGGCGDAGLALGQAWIAAHACAELTETAACA